MFQLLAIPCCLILKIYQLRYHLKQFFRLLKFFPKRFAIDVQGDKKKMLIPEFYSNQVIFLTGGTGFLGKALLEKLLRSCPGIAKIYLLVRIKKGKTPKERVDQVLQDPCFRRLWAEQPDVFEKLALIEGDSRKLQLGISTNDLERLRDVTIVIHAAATIRFNEPIRESVFMNTRGTYELLKIAENLPYLKAFVHISTTYSNPAERVIHEKIYNPTADWRNVLKLAETLDTDTLDTLTAKISNGHPNTYTFTKHLAEQIVFEYSKKLPAIIFRPAIVTSAIEEPCPGWTDNVNGPLGILVVGGLGIKRSDFLGSDAVLSIVPLDVVVRGILIATFKLGMNNGNDSTICKDEMVVYNCTLHEHALYSLGELSYTGKRIIEKVPFDKAVWAPGATIHGNKFTYLLQMLLQEVPFSLLLDTILRLKGEKPKLVKLQRIFANASKALHHFMFTTWHFKIDNFLALENFVAAEDKKDFSFIDTMNADFEKYMTIAMYGIREYILKEPRIPPPGTIRRQKIFKLVSLYEEHVVL